MLKQLDVDDLEPKWQKYNKLLTVNSTLPVNNSRNDIVVGPATRWPEPSSVNTTNSVNNILISKDM